MPKAPLPAEVAELFARPNPAVVAVLRPSGAPMSVATWYLVEDDGRILVNHLQGVCSDLKYEGFSWIIHGTDEVCENQQTLRVLRSGQICVLGKFDVVKDKPAAR